MAGHSCGHEHHEHDHSGPDLGALYSLYTKIDIQKVECLNEETDGSGKFVFKAWDKRMETDKYVQSDADEELLFNIPFTGNVKLKGVIVIGGENDMHPSKMKLFKNRPKMSFDDTSQHCDEEFDLQPDYKGELEYNTKVARFSNVEHLSIYFPTNFGNDNTRVYYIGLKGDFTQAHKHGVTICTYESRANPADHESKAYDPTSQFIH
ncbi:PITH domain-containing protein CG6153-like [Rhopilema esculentum]|uniref:PITH domain-containing protein CG6153-like n=1 Tax=Rhopilema esculentum TaxID=499914 RepID=UPI0031DA3D5D|eukprot:gene7822-13687_t